MKNKINKTVLFLSLIIMFSQFAFPKTNYVSTTGNHIYPFNSWANAATNIQAAVDAALPNDIVLVTNGIYNIGNSVAPGYLSKNRVVITNNITLKSLNGPENTAIVGKEPNGINAIRCVYISSGTLDGFTISNGHTRTSDSDNEKSGGGIYAFDGSSIITNCIIADNASDSAGGGIYYGAVYNCVVTNNSTGYEGGGMAFGNIHNSIICKNSAVVGGGTGGSAVYNCIISDNTASSYGGGAVNGGIFNSLIVGNYSPFAGAVYQAPVNSCTIISNSADNSGGGIAFSTAANCIIWGNSSIDSSNFFNGTISYCCSTPLPPGEGNISQNPLFVSASDFHLQATSPCINAGTNLPYVYTSTDLDGNSRLFGSRVDMGAYEFLPEPCLFVIYYLTFIICYLRKFIPLA